MAEEPPDEFDLAVLDIGAPVWAEASGAAFPSATGEEAGAKGKGKAKLKAKPKRSYTKEFISCMFCE